MSAQRIRQSISDEESRNRILRDLEQERVLRLSLQRQVEELRRKLATRQGVRHAILREEMESRNLILRELAQERALRLLLGRQAEELRRELATPPGNELSSGRS